MNDRTRNTSAAAGFTLPELILAISITAVIGLSAAGVAVGLSTAQGQTDSMIEAVQSARLGMLQVGATLRKARLVTATSADALALWMGDANGDLAMNLDELVSIVYVQASKTVERWQVVFPETMPPATRQALNVTRELSELATTSAVRNLQSSPTYAGYLSKTVLATEVAGLQVVPDTAAPYTRRVLLKMTVGEGTQQITLTDSGFIRCDATGCITTVGGMPTLSLN